MSTPKLVAVLLKLGAAALKLAFPDKVKAGPIITPLPPRRPNTKPVRPAQKN